MTHAVVWIDHTEARIFHVHPEAADESRILSPQHPMFTAIRKAVGSRESTRMMRGISLTTSHEDSMGWTRSSLSGPLQRSTNSSSSCTRITDPLCPRS
jgi:hypothetical protein